MKIRKQLLHYQLVLQSTSVSLYWLIWVYLFWITFGLFILYSTTGFPSAVIYKNSLFFIKKQFCWTILSFVIIIALFKMKKRYFFLIGKIGTTLNLLAINYTLLTNFSINGARRWVEIGPLLYQPVEIEKPFFLLCLSQLLTKTTELKYKEFVFLGLITLGTFLGIFLQPDFASGLLYLSILFIIIFLQQLSYKHLILGIGFCLSFILFNIFLHPYQLNRIISFIQTLGSESTNMNITQLNQSFETIIRGGFFGLGIGCGQTTFESLPVYYADFIFSVFLENFGIFGSMFFFLFLSVYTSFYLSNFIKLIKKPDVIITLGCFLFLILQTCIHLGVTCNLLPITGIPLPFVSYGGNAQLACICLFSLSVRLFYENSRPVLPQKEKKVISI